MALSVRQSNMCEARSSDLAFFVPVYQRTRVYQRTVLYQQDPRGTQQQNDKYLLTNDKNLVNLDSL